MSLILFVCLLFWLFRSSHRAGCFEKNESKHTAKKQNQQNLDAARRRAGNRASDGQLLPERRRRRGCRWHLGLGARAAAGHVNADGRRPVPGAAAGPAALVFFVVGVCALCVPSLFVLCAPALGKKHR